VARQNEVVNKDLALKSKEAELEDKRNRMGRKIEELKAMEGKTVERKRDVDKIELKLIEKETELFEREQAVSRREAK